MKRFITILNTLLLLTSIASFAQAPLAFNYQGIARTSTGAAIASTTISLELTIHSGTGTGTIVYEEKQTATTNAYGLYNVALGRGTVVSGSFSTINWAGGNMWLQVAMDPTGGSSYTNLGVNQLLSVPYSFYANSAGSASVSGTVNYIPKFTSATAVGNSVMYQPASTDAIGINNTTPGATLDVRTATDAVVGQFVTTESVDSAKYGVVNAVYEGTNYGIGARGWALQNVDSNNTFGLQGFGTNEGVLGQAISAKKTGTTNVRGMEGDGFGDDEFSIGVFGSGNNYAGTPLLSVGIYGTATGGSTNYAGYFIGDVYVSGTLYKAGGSFKIDDPIDPDNKYLVHSFVESPDMMNIYNGNITTNASGVATVKLPDYFEALNKDFRYQLTVIGTFAQAIVSRKVSGNTFEIKTNVPNVEVSWQVTGIRKDAWANAHRIPNEVEKEPFNKGKYLDAKDLNKPDNKQIGNEIARPKPCIGTGIPFTPVNNK